MSSRERFYDHRLEAEDELERLANSGALKAVTTVIDGLDHLSRAVGYYVADGRYGKLQPRVAAH